MVLNTTLLIERDNDMVKLLISLGELKRLNDKEFDLICSLYSKKQGYLSTEEIEVKYYQKSNAKYSHSKIEAPIPLALSRLKIELKKAKDTNIIVINIPTIIMIKAFEKSAKTTIGIPAPNINAKDKLIARPANKLYQILLLLMGWLTNNSINSLLL